METKTENHLQSQDYVINARGDYQFLPPTKSSPWDVWLYHKTIEGKKWNREYVNLQEEILYKYYRGNYGQMLEMWKRDANRQNPPSSI